MTQLYECKTPNKCCKSGYCEEKKGWYSDYCYSVPVAQKHNDEVWCVLTHQRRDKTWKANSKHPFDSKRLLYGKKKTTLLDDYENGCFIQVARRQTHHSRKPDEYSDTYFIHNPFSKLNLCDLCGKHGTARRVRYRDDVYDWNLMHDYPIYARKGDPRLAEYFGQGGGKNILCTSCWNKVKPLHKREKEAEELRGLIKTFQKEIKSWQKSQQQAS